MAQTRATTAGDIYTALADDTTFADMLGTRVFRDGTSLQAMSITSPGEQIEGLERVSGLEVIIHDISLPGRRSFITPDTLSLSVWRVFLLAWPPANGADLNDAVLRVMQIFTNADVIDVTGVPEGLGALAQVQVLIPETSVVTTA